MRLKVITVCSHPNDPGYIRLKASMDKFGYDYMTIVTPWRGFGTKIIETYNYVETIKNEYDAFIFIDAFDVIFIRPQASIESVLNEIQVDYDCIFSTEKACWPDSDKASLFPVIDSPWKYLNSGSYLYKIDRFIELVSNNMPEYAVDDQRYFTSLFLDGYMACILDSGCEIFQSIAFAEESDFSITRDSFKNIKTNTRPTILHANGKTDFSKYEHLG